MAVIGLRKTDKVLGPGLYTQLLIDLGDGLVIVIQLMVRT